MSVDGDADLYHYHHDTLACTRPAVNTRACGTIHSSAPLFVNVIPESGNGCAVTSLTPLRYSDRALVLVMRSPDAWHYDAALRVNTFATVVA